MPPNLAAALARFAAGILCLVLFQVGAAYYPLKVGFFILSGYISWVVVLWRTGGWWLVVDGGGGGGGCGGGVGDGGDVVLGDG